MILKKETFASFFDLPACLLNAATMAWRSKEKTEFAKMIELSYNNELGLQ